MTRAIRFFLPIAAIAVLTGCAGAPPTAKPIPKPQADAGTADDAGPASEIDVAPEPVPPAEAWRATAPKPGQAAAPLVPEVRRAVLPNGLTVLVSERHELPLVHVQMAVRAGSALDSPDRLGLASLVFEMLPEGAGDRGAVEIAEAFGDLGTKLNSWASIDGGGLGCTVLARNLDAAAALLADVAQRPRFDPADFERRKKKVLADLVRMRSEPSYRAFEALTEEVFGTAHPYGHLPEGTAAGIGAVAVDDVKRFYAERFGPKSAAIVFVGDITLAEAKRIARKRFGGWRAPAAPPSKPPDPEVSRRTRVRVEAMPGLEQTVIVIGRPGVPAGHADEWALEIANAVFGGMFSSRLNMNLREDKGITYGASAWTNSLYGAGLLVAMTPVDAAKTRVGVTEAFAELNGMTSAPITETELAAARENFLRSFSGSFETGERLAGAIASVFSSGQPIDRWRKMMAAIERLSLADVRAAAAKYYPPDRMRLVLVGDPKTAAAQLEGSELGDLDVRRADLRDAAPAP